ncbi:Testis-expressed sequence 2 protein [Melia azedarach]|uniref:Testis-expressed sequence 2 protein n=1 Tax=Melia azedarach TaxID=155640 RepID=A0ACC1XPD4_MELAZ|nr:Testis-expressed sequence 2 protein [Melia azedarach]
MQSSSSPFFSHRQHLSCTASTSSASNKRPASLNPSLNEPQLTPKKKCHNNIPCSHIPPSPPPQEMKFPVNYASVKLPLRPPKIGVSNALHSPTQRASSSCPVTQPLNYALPPRPGPWKRGVSDAMRSLSHRVSGSCPNLKMEECIWEINQMGKLLDCVEDCANVQTDMMSHSPTFMAQNMHNDSAMESDELSEIVVVEKNGDALIIDVKCPCGAGYQILLIGGVSYYKLA